MIDLLRDELIKWYRMNGRSLPWREVTDPYQIWLSEIILQQTRVNQGMPYYFKFVEKYKTVHDLANASEQDVLNTWQGLGYYSRARNLHTTAKYISIELNGVFPDNYDDILKLKGVGAYTAAAIASAAFNQPKAVLDGNVFRVLARIFNIDKNIADVKSRPIFQKIADDLLDQKNPAEFNQAMMDFGATQCSPKSPNCITCPVNQHCKAVQLGRVSQLPVKVKNLKRTTRYFHFFVSEQKTNVYLQKRVSKGIWQGLFQLPLIETKGAQFDTELTEAFMHNNSVPKLVFEKMHKLTHQDIVARFYELKGDIKVNGYTKVHVDELSNYPIPRLIDMFFQSWL
ncbi:MAG: A/G-specific adenine glycosylase [Bacteroidia bacterium]